MDGHEGDVRKLTRDETDRVVDTCYQCKLCYVKCPYTPDDGHEFQLDFPRLLMRVMALRAKEKGISLRSRLLSRPELLGKFAKLTPGLANWANRQPMMRTAWRPCGIHREKQLPDFHGETFEDWYRQQPQPTGDDSKAVLFYTCFVNYNHPQVGKDAVDVFSRNGVALTCPKQNCCGMPALEAGDIQLAKSLAEAMCARSIRTRRRARRSWPSTRPAPTCCARSTRTGGHAGSQEGGRGRAGSLRVPVRIEEAGPVQSRLPVDAGNRGLPPALSLEGAEIGFRSRDMLRLIPGSTVKLVEQCCGHDGTWAMKKEFFPLSRLAGKKAFDQMAEVGADHGDRLPTGRRAV